MAVAPARQRIGQRRSSYIGTNPRHLSWRSLVYSPVMPWPNLHTKLAAALHHRYKRSPRAKECPWRDPGQRLKRKVPAMDRVEPDDLP